MIAMTIILFFVHHRMIGLSCKHSFLVVGALAALGMGADILLIQPLLLMPNGAFFITKTSLGIAVGSGIEALFSGAMIFILWVVKKCRKTKIRFY